MLVEKPMATSLTEAAELVELAASSPGHLLPAPHILLSPTYRAIKARVEAGEIGSVVSGPRPLWLVGPRLGRLVLPQGRRCAVRPRRLQRRGAVRHLRPGPARDGDDRRRDPAPRHRGRGRAGRGRGQRARADRLRRGAAGRRHDRLHDAEVPLARDRAVRHDRRAATARRRLGAGGLRAVAQRPRRLGDPRRDRPDLAVDRRPPPPRALHRRRSRPGDPARARLPRARDHARRAGGRRRRPRPRHHEPVPGPDYASLPATVDDHRRVHDRGQPCDDYSPSPRPTFDGPTAIPFDLRHPARLGRRRGGRGGRLDLRVDRARSTASSSACRSMAPSATRASS